MKKLILSIAIMFALGVTAKAQTVVKDAQGNYHAVKKDSTSASAGKPTGQTFTDTKGQVYPILISARGKLYYERTAKTSGNIYKVYIKEN